MKEKANGVGTLKLSGTRKFCADIDTLRAEERKRRRLLRLEQVRQQTKDIACDIRRKVRLEKNCEAENIQKRNEVATAVWKEQKLTALQNELTQTLSCVGSAHGQAEREAKKDQARKEEKSRLLEDADRRGRDALLRLRSDELARKQAAEAKKMKQHHNRMVEEARTAVVVSLPTPKSTVPVGNAPLQKAAKVKKIKSSESNIEKCWPSKAWPVSTPLGVTPADIEENDKPGSTAELLNTGVDKDQEADHRVCSKKPLRDASSKISTAFNQFARTISDKNKVQESKPSSVALAKSRTEPQEVALYDYTNGNHVQYVQPSAVSKSLPAGPVDGLEAAEAFALDSTLKKNLSRESTCKRIERGKEALKRVQARRERQILLTELAGLVRQKAALSSFQHSEPEQPVMVQEKLNEAVINILKEPASQTILKESVKKAESVTGGINENDPEASETTIDVCSPDEPDDPMTDLNKRDFKVTLETKTTHLSGDALSDSQTTLKETCESVLANETIMSESISSDVPKLNLALWTSRSPGMSDPADKTLTPTEKQKENNSFKTSLSSTDKSESPEEKREAEIPRESEITTAQTRPKQRGKMTVKIAKEKSSKEIHPGSGDGPNVGVQRTPSKRNNSPNPVSPEPLPKKNIKDDTPSSSEQCRRRSKKESPSSSGSTSYMSLPNKLLSAITHDLRSLLSLTRRRKKTDTNPVLAHYINRLLDMSRQSVERLNVVASEVPTPSSTIFRNSSNDSSRRSFSLPSYNSAELDAPDNAEKRGDCSSRSRNSELSSSSTDNSELLDVMRQCHARISKLSQMIDQVRQENVASINHNRMSSSLHFDSTVYLSPPNSGLDSPQMLPRRTEQPEINRMDDTYGAVITRLVSEIRQQLSKEAEKPIQIPLSPPHSVEKNIKKSSSNDLSTIPEQDSSPLEWSNVVLSSETADSSEDVEKEFRRMGLGWAEATLRKTKQACTLDSNSSSDFLELSALSLFGSYSHSTPIKAMEEKRG